MNRLRIDDAGLTLIEVMVAVMVLTASLLSVARVSATGLASLGDSRQRQQAVVLATRSLETARTYPYASLAMRTAETPETTWDPDGAGALPAEQVVRTDTGSVTGASHQVTAGAGSQTLRTYVTWYDDPDVGGAQNAKRVTTVVGWTAAGGVREVRMSTLVADVR